MAWLATVTKLAPYIIQLSEIGVSALPHITRRKNPPVAPAPVESKAVEVDRVTQQQIGELQAAVTQNAEHIRELAISLKSAITAIETRIRRLELIVYVLVAVSVIALLGTVFEILYR
jgi:hypothetical protein